MTLRTISVPNPAAGTDWKYTVPGQWLLDLSSVTANLSSSVTVATFPDETGNGHDLTIDPTAGYTVGAPGPYGGGANDYATAHDASTGGNNGPCAVTASDILFGSASLTVDGWWYSLSMGATNDNGDMWGLFRPPNGQDFSAYGARPSTTQINMGFQSIGSAGTVKSNYATTNAWHHMAWVYSAPTWSCYVDGALSFTTNTHPPINRGVTQRFEVPGNHGLGTWHGSAGGVAYYASALSAGQIAAHAGAGGSWAGYRAAVLADGPGAFWGLNTAPTLAQRSVSLEVTDGTRTVLSVPGFQSAQTGLGFAWTWLVGASSSVQSTSQATTVIAIPPLVLPAGYTIGTKTLDLAGTDQWSNIAIWWDDAAQQQQQGTSDYVYPPGVTYVIRR